jgi:glycosyltransferase involved in cell wall biosynthesis
MSAPRIMVLTTVPQTMAAFFPRQLRMLAEAGFEVHAVSSPGDALDSLGRECGVTTHGVPMERQPDPIRDAVSSGRLLRLMRRIRPDVVHAHTPKAGLLGMLAARLAGVPVRLYTVHGLPLVTRTGLWRRVLETAERTSAALSTRTYCVSHSVRREVVGLRLCPDRKTFTLGAGSCAGIDTNRFHPADERGKVRNRLGIPEDATVVAFVGRLAKDKGIGVLAAAWPLVTRQRPDLHLLLAGEEDDTDPVAPEAMARLRAFPLVHWAGSVSKTDVPGIYRATDICVLPTFREGLSQVALEAGAMGVPIVSSDVLGLDAVLSGVTGILVAPREPQLLAEAILKLAESPELRQEMGRAGIEHIRAKYSDQRVNNLWMTEYRHLVAAIGPNRNTTTAIEAQTE